MAIDVDAVAVPRMCHVDRLCHSGVVRLPAGFDACLHLWHRQAARIQRQTLVSGAPDQAFAEAHFGQHNRFGGKLARPGLVEHGFVNFGDIAVGIQVAARKQRLDPGRAQSGSKVVQLLDMRVLGAAQQGQLAAKTKVRRVLRATVRRVQYQWRLAGVVDQKW